MTLGKRLFDLISATAVLLLVWPVIAWIAFHIWRQKDGPIFYVSERMKTPNKAMQLLKFRTMADRPRAASGVTGGDKSAEITALGARLRKHRLDELPQLWNIIRGDLSLVGPRPPLRDYVERFPALYGEVLQSRPGVTGLATLIYHEQEAKLLEACNTADETDTVYSRRCIPAKARLDLIYQRNFRACLDYWIIWHTLRKLFTGRAITGKKNRD